MIGTYIYIYISIVVERLLSRQIKREAVIKIGDSTLNGNNIAGVFD